MNENANWIRLEHERVEQLADQLRGKVAVVPRANLGPWIKEIRESFERFRAHFTKHMALEEQGGYLAAVLERRPGLAGQVERLDREHIELIRIMDGVYRLACDMTPDDRLLVRDCCGRINDLLDYVEHHEDEENLLVTYVFSQDIGTKD
jgi:hypothetical protein